MADVFEQRSDLVPWRELLWEVIAKTPYLDWQLLTKRPEAVARSVPWQRGCWPVNVWLGTTVENGTVATSRIRSIVDCGAPISFLSMEPLLERIDLGPWLSDIDWIIVGGESGPHARPFDTDWAEDLILQADSSGVAPFVKQLGSRPVSSGRPLVLRDRKGGEIDEWPSELRRRDFPVTEGCQGKDGLRGLSLNSSKV
jgi:protein gp37